MEKCPCCQGTQTYLVKLEKGWEKIVYLKCRSCGWILECKRYEIPQKEKAHLAI